MFTKYKDYKDYIAQMNELDIKTSDSLTNEFQIKAKIYGDSEVIKYFLTKMQAFRYANKKGCPIDILND